MSKPVAGPAVLKTPYYDSLDSLRFYSALAVIVTHIELIKALHDYTGFYSNIIVLNLGPVGVYFFFTLSGFLITRLLLNEERTTGKISVWHFYVRRSLRIWPLYFVCVFLGFFLLPHFAIFDVPSQTNYLDIGFWNKFALYCAFLPHVAGAMYPKVPNIGQLWSIGVEEVFYLIWPMIVIAFRERWVRYAALLIGLVAIKSVFFCAFHMQSIPSERMLIWKEVLAASKFECMVIGGMFALPITSKWREFLGQSWLQVGVLSMIPVAFLVYATKFDDVVFLVFAILFSVLIWNSAENGGAVLSGNKICNYFGRISYGIYCYHFLVVSMVVNAVPERWFSQPLFANLIVYSAVIGITLVISVVSYVCFERPINRLKFLVGYQRVYKRND